MFSGCDKSCEASRTSSTVVNKPHTLTNLNTFEFDQGSFRQPLQMFHFAVRDRAARLAPLRYVTLKAAWVHRVQCLKYTCMLTISLRKRSTPSSVCMQLQLPMSTQLDVCSKSQHCACSSSTIHQDGVGSLPVVFAGRLSTSTIPQEPVAAQFSFRSTRDKRGRRHSGTLKMGGRLRT